MDVLAARIGALAAQVAANYHAFMNIQHMDAILLMVAGGTLVGVVPYATKKLSGTIDAPPPETPTDNDIVEDEQQTLDDILTNVELPAPLPPAPNVPVPSIWGHPNTVSYTPSEPWNQALTLRTRVPPVQASPWPAFVISASLLSFVVYLAWLIYKCCFGHQNNAAAADDDDDDDGAHEDPVNAVPQGPVPQTPVPPNAPTNGPVNAPANAPTSNAAPATRANNSAATTGPADVANLRQQIRDLTNINATLVEQVQEAQSQKEAAATTSRKALDRKETAEARIGVLEQRLRDSQNEAESLRTQLTEKEKRISDSESATPATSERERELQEDLEDERSLRTTAYSELENRRALDAERNEELSRLRRENSVLQGQIDQLQKRSSGPEDKGTQSNGPPASHVRSLTAASETPSIDSLYTNEHGQPLPTQPAQVTAQQSTNSTFEQYHNLQAVIRELMDQAEIARRRADEDTNTIALLQSALNRKDDEFEAEHKSLKDKLRAYEQTEDDTANDDQAEPQSSDIEVNALIAAQREDLERYKEKNVGLAKAANLSALQVRDVGRRLAAKESRAAAELRAKGSEIERLHGENSQLHDRVKTLEEQINGLSNAQNHATSEAAQADLQRRLDQANGEVSRLTNEAAAARQQSEEVNSNTRKLEDTIQDLKKQLSKSEEDLEDCNLARKESSTRERYDEAIERAEDAENKHAAAQEEIEKLKNQLKSCNDCDKLREGEGDCKCNGEELDQAKETIESQRAKIENLRQQLDDRNRDLENLDDDYEDLEKMRAADRERLVEVEGLLSTRDAQYGFLGEQLKETKADLEAVRKELKDRQGKLDDCETKRKQEAGKAKFGQALQQENGILKAENETLRKELDGRQGKLDDCESRSKRQAEQLKDAAAKQHENTPPKAQLDNGNAEPTEATKSTPAAESETTVESEDNDVTEESPQEPEATTGDSHVDAAAESSTTKEQQDDTSTADTAAESQDSHANEDTSKESESATNKTHE